MQYSILAHLHVARSLGHLPRRPVYVEYLGAVIDRTECRQCGACLVTAGPVVTITAMLDCPCPGRPAAARQDVA